MLFVGHGVVRMRIPSDGLKVEFFSRLSVVTSDDNPMLMIHTHSSIRAYCYSLKVTKSWVVMYEYGKQLAVYLAKTELDVWIA